LHDRLDSSTETGPVKAPEMRSERSEETEFVTVNLFESLDAVTSFAGPDYEAPVFEPEAGRLLSRVEPISRHYDVRKAPDLVWTRDNGRAMK